MAGDAPPNSGMFPDEPTARCSECEHWSYLAAIVGRCLACALKQSGGSGGAS